MSAQLLAGGPVAEAVLDDVRTRVDALRAAGTTPGLGTILVGDDGASAGYVRKKHETCESVGMVSYHIQVEADDPVEALDEAVAAINAASAKAEEVDFVATRRPKQQKPAVRPASVVLWGALGRSVQQHW